MCCYSGISCRPRLDGREGGMERVPSSAGQGRGRDMTGVDKKAQVQELYGAHARAYTTSTVHARGASLERLVAQVAPKGHELVLDVATGTGHNALSLAPHVRHVIGLDLTAAMLTEACGLARQRGLGNVRFCRGDSER